MLNIGKIVSTTTEDADSNLESNNCQLLEDSSLSKKLQQTIQFAITPSENNVHKCSILKEFNMAVGRGTLTTNLLLLKNALNTIKPTSTQNEHNCSIATNLVTKLRTRLGGNNIDKISF
jgi:hypothetical protein